jgi:hypothetical protein
MRWEEAEVKLEGIEGYLLPGQDQWLFEQASGLPYGATILEIGPFKGWSTACLAFGCVDTAKKVISIDTFEGNDHDFIDGRDFEGNFLVEFLANLESLGVKKYVAARVGRSSLFYSAWTAPIDFLFIDGSHKYEDALGDLCSFGKHVVPGGIVAMHDVTPQCEGPWKAWHAMGPTLLRDIDWCQTIAYGYRRDDNDSDDD